MSLRRHPRLGMIKDMSNARNYRPLRQVIDHPVRQIGDHCCSLDVRSSDGVQGGVESGDSRSGAALAVRHQPARYINWYGAVASDSAQVHRGGRGGGLARDGPAPSEEQLTRLAGLSIAGPRKVETPDETETADETVAAQEQQTEQQQQAVQQFAVGETTHREAEGRKEYGRRRSADEQRQDDDPDRVPKATPRPPGTFPRQVEHQERVEYSYDPGTGQFAAKLVRSSRPVVMGWDPSAPEAVERQIGTWEVTPTGTGVAAESGDSAAQAVPADVQAELKRRAEQESGPVSESASVRFSHDLVTRETDTRVSMPKRDAASHAVGRSRGFTLGSGRQPVGCAE